MSPKASQSTRLKNTHETATTKEAVSYKSVDVSSMQWMHDTVSLDDFVARVWDAGRAYYRELPWRNIDDAYGVLVSEVMLQQTQVARVLQFWPRFMAAFPTVDALSAASTSDVLGMWQGLGYNRRALALKRAANICSVNYKGQLPKDLDELQALPGIGPATAAGVRAFAFQLSGIYLETNVRAVFIHELFPEAEKVSDKQLVPLVAASVSHDNPRGWYYALLDYGAHLKATLPNPSRKSAHHTRQSTFEGSRRQKRSWIVRYVLASPEGVACKEVLAALNRAERAAGRTALTRPEFDSIINDLLTEGFFSSVEDVLIP